MPRFQSLASGDSIAAQLRLSAAQLRLSAAQLRLSVAQLELEGARSRTQNPAVKIGMYA
jgi:hypothetical protein